MKSITKEHQSTCTYIIESLTGIFEILLIPLLTVSLLLLNQPVNAKDYTRSCKATYIFSAETPDGARLQGAQREFQGKGTAAHNPNKAREKARRNIDECITKHWENRNATHRPSECTESNQIYNYPFTSLHFGIQQALCSRNPGRQRIDATITVTYTGDKGCLLDRNNWRRSVATDHRIKCPTAEVEQNVDRPGMDYTHFNLPPLATSERCRSRCARDSRCQAWTYVKPTGENPPVCWLKSGVPSPRQDRCCVSGVKTDLH